MSTGDAGDWIRDVKTRVSGVVCGNVVAALQRLVSLTVSDEAWKSGVESAAARRA